jgi:hypothetical protein
MKTRCVLIVSIVSRFYSKLMHRIKLTCKNTLKRYFHIYIYKIYAMKLQPTVFVELYKIINYIYKNEKNCIL